MKNKSAVLFALCLMAFLAGSSYALSLRGAKSMVAISQTTNSVGISSGPAVLYSVIMGTGAVTDFVTFFDSGSVVGLTALGQSGAYRIRVYPTSATQNTVVSFDPPLQFKNGIIAIPATGLGSAVVTWEAGRVTQGY